MSVHYTWIINYYCALIRACSIRSTTYRKQKTTQVMMLKYFGLSLRLGYSRNFSWNILKSMENNKLRSFIIVLQVMNMILLCSTWFITKCHSSSSYALLLCCTTIYCFVLPACSKMFRTCFCRLLFMGRSLIVSTESNAKGRHRSASLLVFTYTVDVEIIIEDWTIERWDQN